MGIAVVLAGLTVETVPAEGRCAAACGSGGGGGGVMEGLLFM